MADKKISQLTSATTPLAGTEELPIVQSGTTKKVATDDLTVKNIRSNATTGTMQISGPAAASTRVVTVPDANATMARTDAGQVFTGDQRFANNVAIGPYAATYPLDVVAASASGARVYSDVGGQTAVQILLGTGANSVNAAVKSFTVSAGDSAIILQADTGGVLTDYLVVKGDSAGDVTPGSNNAQKLGIAGTRWSEVFAVNGTINTSDARQKTSVAELTQDELNAAKQLAKEIGTFKFLSAVEKKGEAARTHIGMTVQRAIEIMQQNNLDPMAYGFICYDEWKESRMEYPAQYEEIFVPAQLDDQGNIIKEGHFVQGKLVLEAGVKVTPAGNEYGFRVDQLLLFIARGFEARLTALEN